MLNFMNKIKSNLQLSTVSKMHKRNIKFLLPVLKIFKKLCGTSVCDKLESFQPLLANPFVSIFFVVFRTFIGSKF